jgi:hypothetical protein
MAASKRAEPVEMRLDMAEQPIRQVDAQQIGQRRIGAVEIHAGGIGCEQTGSVGGRRHIVVSGSFKHLQLLFVPRPMSDAWFR